MDLNITTLSPEDWAKYRQFRLDASKQDSNAWGLTYEEELEYTDDWWREQLEKAANKEGNWIYFAQVGDEIVGVVASNRIKKTKMNHIAHIHSVSVKKEFRGQGIASKLMQKLLESIKEDQKILIAQMGVSASQEGAVALYQKFGFKIVGRREKVFHNGEYYFDEILMEKFLP